MPTSGFLNAQTVGVPLTDALDGGCNGRPDRHDPVGHFQCRTPMGQDRARDCEASDGVVDCVFIFFVEVARRPVEQ